MHFLSGAGNHATNSHQSTLAYAATPNRTTPNISQNRRPERSAAAGTSISTALPIAVSKLVLIFDLTSTSILLHAGRTHTHTINEKRARLDVRGHDLRVIVLSDTW